MGCIKSKPKENAISDLQTQQDQAPPKTVDPRLPFETYRQLFNLKNSWKAVTRVMDDTAKHNLLM